MMAVPGNANVKPVYDQARHNGTPLRKLHFDNLMQTLADMAHELPIDGSFQVSSLQRLTTLFRDGEAYREFALMILEEVQTGVEKSAYSPLLPLTDKIRLFELVQAAIADNNLAQLKIFSQQLFELQPGWKRVWIHSSRRKGRDRQLVLLEHAVKSFVEGRYQSILSSFQMVCLYLSSLDSEKFRFAADAAPKLLKIRNFWLNHPPQFSDTPARKTRQVTTSSPSSELQPLPTPDTAAAEKNHARGEN